MYCCSHIIIRGKKQTMIINDMVGEILNQDGRNFYFYFYFCHNICRFRILRFPRFSGLSGWQPFCLFWPGQVCLLVLPDPLFFLFLPTLLFRLAFWVVLVAWFRRWFFGQNMLLFYGCFVHIVGSRHRLADVSGIPLGGHLSLLLRNMARGFPGLGICPLARVVPCFPGCLHPSGEGSTFQSPCPSQRPLSCPCL